MSDPLTVPGEPPVLAGLLRTKLTVPRPRPGALPRSALVEHLRVGGVPGRLTVVVAGAGWGKSTLLALWRDHDPRPDRFKWFSIGPSNNDATQFCWGLKVSRQSCCSPVGEVLGL